jgi:threonine aldolase
MKTIELRSDTFTMPTDEMLDAMRWAPLGDDVYGEDPTVRLLEEKAADRLGMTAACLMPSGTMANLATLTAHAPRGSRIFAGRDSDIYVYEAHGVSVCSGVALDPIATDDDGLLDLEQLERSLPEDQADPQFSMPSVVCVENTANRAGGVPIGPEHMAEVAAFARRHGLAVHLDGARIFNAAVALKTTVAELARDADSVQFCLSKGLSAPIGSMVAGSGELITQVRRVRKMLGGGMRQAGVIAAAGIVALDTMVDRLAIDHEHAAALADGLAAIPGVAIDSVSLRTNMVRFRVLDSPISHQQLIELAAWQGVRLAELGRGCIRAVTHRGIDADDIERALSVIDRIVRSHTRKAS